MELDPLFTEQRWKILKNLSSEKLSPLQLANKTDTTISNISQQLKLLEAANIIRKEKIQNRDKGKPRALFSLSKDYAYIVSVMDGFVEKKLFSIENGKKAMLKIWFLGDSELQDEVEHAYNKLKPSLNKIDGILLNVNKKEMFLVGRNVTKEMLSTVDKSSMLKIKSATEKETTTYINKSSEAEDKLVAIYENHISFKIPENNNPEKLALTQI